MFPVENPELRAKLWHILDTELKDNVKAHIMDANGEYQKVNRRGKDAINSQKIFGIEATELVKPKDITESRVFEPEYRDYHGL